MKPDACHDENNAAKMQPATSLSMQLGAFEVVRTLSNAVSILLQKACMYPPNATQESRMLRTPSPKYAWRCDATERTAQKGS